MVGSAEAASDDRLACEKCHGFYAVEVPEPGATPRVRCNSCGNIREVDAPPTPKLEEKGKWTVIGPDGKVMTFGSWEKLVESTSQRPPPPEEKKVSASALLDITPPPQAPKLMLEDLESNPILPVRPSSRPKSTPPPLWAAMKPPSSEKEKKDLAPSVEPSNPLPSTKRDPGAAAAAAAAAEEEAPLSLKDAIVEDEAAPLSLRDVLPEENEASPLSLKDVISSDDESDPTGHEVVSLDEVVLVTPETASVESTNPHPPARGALRTLPPSRAKGDLAPPPTISLETESQAVTTKVTAATVAKAAAATKKDERKASARPAPVQEAPKRGWVIPALAAGGAIVLWRLMAAPTNPETPAPVAVTTPSQPTTTASAAETVAPPSTPAPTDETPSTSPSALATAAETAPVAPATPKAAATPKTTSEGDTTTAAAKTEKTEKTEKIEKTEKTEKPAAETGLSMSDLLDRAGSAKRSGDFATARELYEKVTKQNPGNVEANGGLGDVAKAQGDTSAAKTSYERALAASPTYVPALIGLADIDWDQGNRAPAQKRYAQIVDQLGRRAPERARQRSTPSE